MNPSPLQLSQSLKSEAERLGFALTGVCPAVTPLGYSRFLEWLDAGYAGEMLYLSERRTAYRDPGSVLANVQSILMLGMHYRSGEREAAGPGQGNIARYAWGTTDYHDLIHGRLKQLKAYAQQLLPEASVRGVVDTAPLLEREFAQLAGIGWIGKNTLLLNKHSGSFFFLAALLLDCELEPDAPTATDHCGTCTACLDACPTDAFVQPFVLDATRCISYLTIEHRSQIPRPLRGALDGWVFGCDVCQDVCPWNRKSPLSREVSFQALDGNNPLDLMDLFWLDDEQFRERFRKTPLWRPRRRGLLRNAAIVLGGQPDANQIAALARGLDDEEPLVRGAAAWALGQHNWPASEVALQQRYTQESDPSVRDEIEAALSLLTAGNGPPNGNR